MHACMRVVCVYVDLSLQSEAMVMFLISSADRGPALVRTSRRRSLTGGAPK